MSQSGSGKLDPDLAGGGVAGAVFEWSGSKLYELNYWIHL